MSAFERFRFNGANGGSPQTNGASRVPVSNGSSNGLPQTETNNGSTSNGGDSECHLSPGECERLLQMFQRRFSDIDKMDIQDALVRNSWDKDLAMKLLDSEYTKLVAKKKEKNTSTCSSPNIQRKMVTVIPVNRPNIHKYKTINALAAEKLNIETREVNGGKIKKRRARFDDSSDEDSSAKRDRVYYSSDSDSDLERDSRGRSNTELGRNRELVIEFLNEASPLELESVPKLSKKRVDKVICLRPFLSYEQAVKIMKTTPGLTPDILNEVKNMMTSRNIIEKLMTSCQDIAREMEEAVDKIKSSYLRIAHQPANLNPSMKLAPHQLIGINWLALLYSKGLNGILADEMGLGKTVQVVAFLGWLLSQKERGPHLVVVPSSTLDNWHREFTTWCPDLQTVIYSGPQEDRKELRLNVLNNRISMNVVLTTYSTLSSTPEDRGFFKRVTFHHAVFDEAHMLKNMTTQRYQSLMQVSSKFKLMLTGTPLQNNLIELMSLLTFTMPNMFESKTDHMKSLFKGCKASGEGENSTRGRYERVRLEQAKAIMKPFVLRRLKADVLDNLPKKHESTERIKMTERQQKHYLRLVSAFKKGPLCDKVEGDVNSEGSVIMQLRKGANHPLLLRTHYVDEKLKKMAKIICKDPSHPESTPDRVFEDMEVMSDFELHNLCTTYACLLEYRLPDDLILDSGKFEFLQNLIPEQLEKKNRILIFSQFTMVLDIVEQFLHILKYNYLRIDGSTPVTERQDLIDVFVNDDSIPIFLLSTKACGLGVNLTAANVVVLHDIDFNPYNDKQAEDRCHRIGQTREVFIYRLIAKGTIEEGMHSIAQDKLKLEKHVTSNDEESGEEKATVVKLLKQALEAADA